MNLQLEIFLKSRVYCTRKPEWKCWKIEKILFQIQNFCQFWAKSRFSQKDTHRAFSFLFSSVSIIQEQKFGMYFAQPSFSVFEWCDMNNMGCRVFKWWVQNWKDFCLKINIPKRNHWILIIGVRDRSQTTLTRFWLFLTTYPPAWRVLWYERWQKVDIFGAPTYLVL